MRHDPLLPPAAFLPLLRSDGDRLAVAAEQADPATAVPTCPGWTVPDLLEHTGIVFAHKVATLRLGRRPERAEIETPAEGIALPDLLGWYRGQLDRLVEILAGRDPAAPAWTWYAPEQTTAFWLRRMAHEAAVHRIDAEAAIGSYTAVDEALAADGVHEVLAVFAGAEGTAAEAGDVGRPGLVEVIARPANWTVRLPATGELIITRDSAVSPSEARIEAAPVAMYLWLWGRTDAAADLAGEVLESGDAEVLARLHSRLAVAL